MLDLNEKIERLERGQAELDAKISALDESLAGALLKQAAFETDPARKAANVAIRDMFTSLADLLFALGETTARLNDARELAGEMAPLGRPLPADRMRVRVAGDERAGEES